MNEIKLTAEQQKVFDVLKEQKFWNFGRGSGKSFLRDQLIQWLANEEIREQRGSY